MINVSSGAGEGCFTLQGCQTHRLKVMLGLALGISSISLGLWFSRAVQAELLSVEQQEGKAVQALQVTGRAG